MTDDVPYRVEGCGRPATTSRPSGVTADGTPTDEPTCERCADPPLCGDPTCEGPGCRQSAIDAWDERMQREARDIVRSFLGLPSEPR